MNTTLVIRRAELDRLEEKFMSLLNVERTSAEFARLYAEVDEQLTMLVRREGTPFAKRHGKLPC